MKTPAAKLFPMWAVEALQRAAATPITKQDPLARTRAIEEATKQLKNTYPKRFIKEY